MSDNIIKLKIKVDDNLKFVETNADELKDALGRVKTEADKLNSDLINSNQIAQAFDQMSSAVQSLQSVMHDLTNAYAVQSAAEARLGQVMRNTMDASEAEIQSIKDLAAAQQQLGIVGDEVQLSGAQELATYLSKKESLEALIPVMNDMIAQQYGYNASAESAVTIASMMGKVLDGEVGALSRYGYTFTDAQERILEFGTEEERAATLAEVVEQSVGGMNEALASTPYGRIVQANNAFGDLRENIGRAIAPAMMAVDKIARVSIASAGIGKGIAGLKALRLSLQALMGSASMAAVKVKLLATHSRVTALAQRMLAGANGAATVSTRALTAATVGLYAAITFGLSAAITGIVTLIDRLTSSSKDAAEGLDGLKEAQDAMKQSYGDAKSEIDSEIAALRKLIEAGGDTAETIVRLNEKYAEVFGYHSTAADWYDTLTQKSEAYCRQLGYEAKAKSLSAKIGALIVERDEKQKEADENPNKYRRYGVVDPVTREVTVRTTTQETRVYARQKKDVAELNKQIEALTSEMQASYGEAAKAADQLSDKTAENAETVSWQTISYTDLGKAIEEQKKKLGAYSDASSAEAKQEKATLQAMQLRYDALGKALGIVGENTEANTKKTVKLGNKLTNLKEINAKIAELEKQRLEASKDEIKAIDTQIDRVKRLKAEFEGTPATSNLTPTIKPIHTPGNLYPDKPTSAPETLPSLRKYENQLSSLREMRLDAPKEMIPIIDDEIASVQKLKDEFEGVSEQTVKMSKPSFSEGWNGIKGVGNSIRDITNALNEDNDAWTKITGTIDGFIGIVQGLQAIIKVIDGISAATKAMAAANSAASAKNVASNTAETTSNISKAASGAAGSVSSIPIVGPALAIAAVAAVLASLSSLPKFAGGGIVYGPTLGLMGEYGGASSNPEVIAPLSRLRSLIGGNGGGVDEVRFRIEGRNLIGISRKQNNIDRRTR